MKDLRVGLRITHHRCCGFWALISMRRCSTAFSASALFGYLSTVPINTDFRLPFSKYLNCQTSGPFLRFLRLKSRYWYRACICPPFKMKVSCGTLSVRSLPENRPTLQGPMPGSARISRPSMQESRLPWPSAQEPWGGLSTRLRLPSMLRVLPRRSPFSRVIKGLPPGSSRGAACQATVVLAYF